MSSSVCRLRLSGHFSRHIRTIPAPRRICRRLASNAPVRLECTSSTIVEGEENGSSSRIAAEDTQRSPREPSPSVDQAPDSAHATLKSTSPSISSPKKSNIVPVEPHFAAHLEGVFPSLKFPPELARRMLTHASHPAAVHGHNGVYSFLGRRALESYLMLFLTSSSALQPSHDLDDIAVRALSAYTLGEFVGSQWGLGRVLRWTPTVSRDKFNNMFAPAIARSAGLYKVQGTTVAAVLGGIFYQFGASEAHRTFHTRILPLLFLGRKTEGMPETFRRDAMAISLQMTQNTTSSEATQPPSSHATQVSDSPAAPRRRISRGYTSQSTKREPLKMAL